MNALPTDLEKDLLRPECGLSGEHSESLDVWRLGEATFVYRLRNWPLNGVLGHKERDSERSSKTTG